MNLEDLDKRAKARGRIRTKRAVRNVGRVVRGTGRAVHRAGTLMWRGLESIPQDNRRPRRHYRL